MSNGAPLVDSAGVPLVDATGAPMADNGTVTPCCCGCGPCPPDSPSSAVAAVTFDCPEDCPYSPIGTTETATFDLAETAPGSCSLVGQSLLPDGPSNCLEVGEGITPSNSAFVQVTVTYSQARCGWAGGVSIEGCGGCTYQIFKAGISPLGTYTLDPTFTPNPPTDPACPTCSPCKPCPVVVIS